MMKRKKAVLVVFVVIFVALLGHFFGTEKARYQKVSQDLKTPEEVTYWSLSDIAYAKETTFLSLEKFADPIISKASKVEHCYIDKEGKVVTHPDSWMFANGLIKRQAKPVEVKNHYKDYFQFMKGNISGFAPVLFYFLKLVIFFVTSVIPSLIVGILPSISLFSVKYAAAAFGLLMLLSSIEKAQAGQTIFEADYETNGKEAHYSFLVLNFRENMTSVLFLPGNSNVALAMGPNTNVLNGSLSGLFGLHTGNTKHGLGLKEMSLWYVYFGDISEKVGYVTFGLWDKDLYSKNWYSWCKHQVAYKFSKHFEAGFRTDLMLFPKGKTQITYGPSMTFHWNKLTTHFDYKIGKENKLLLRASVPIQ